LAVPVFCKIRILPTFEETLSFALMLQKAGCSMLVVHGRRRERLHHEGAANWDWIKRIKEALDIPVVANGNVQSFEVAHYPHHLATQSLHS
jgi:tRNA-dihydrouridine synthase 1